MTDRIYRVEIASYPEGSDESGWRPEGWDGYPWRPDDDDWDAFRWPSTSHLYASRSGAMARKALIESYGATARVLVTNTEWVEERQSAKLRRLARAHERAERLRDKALAIEMAAAREAAA